MGVSFRNDPAELGCRLNPVGILLCEEVVLKVGFARSAGIEAVSSHKN
jgi:hypothetical protein